MALQQINTSTTLTDYTQRTILDGREYVLHLRWNGRSAKWFLSVLDQDESPIVQGIKIVADFPLLESAVDDRLPPGVLLALDTTQEGRDPGLTELGDRVVLVYQEAE